MGHGNTRFSDIFFKETTVVTSVCCPTNKGPSNKGSVLKVKNFKVPYEHIWHETKLERDLGAVDKTFPS